MPRNRSYNFAYMSAVDDFIAEARRNPEILYSVSLTDKKTEQPVVAAATFAELLGFKVGIGGAIAKNLPDRLAEIESLMRTEGQLQDGVKAIELNFINQMKLFLVRLERGEEPYEKIQVFGESLRVEKLISDFPHYRFKKGMIAPARYKDAAKFYRNEFTMRIFQVLKYKGVYDHSSYVPVSEREARPADEGDLPKFIKIKKGLQIDSVSELEELCSEPFDALYYTVALAARTSSSTSTTSNYFAAYQHLRKLLSSVGMSGNETLFSMVNKYTPSKFRAYLEDLIATGELSPSYSSTMLSAIQVALNRLAELKGADDFSFIQVAGFNTKGRTTEKYKPYPSNQRKIIADVLDREMNAVWERHTKPYSKTSIGTTFLGQKNGRPMIVSELCTEENLRWFFDHELDGKRITFHDVKGFNSNSKEYLFYQATQRYRTTQDKAHQSLESLYESWGVPRPPYRDELQPFYLRLVQITGMNPDSALYLQVDAFESKHPVTFRPCLRYWKERSQGAKEMLLDIFDAEIAWLSSSQASQVADIIQKMAKLTRSLRNELSDSDEKKGLLFIAAGKPPRGYGKITTLAANHQVTEKKSLEDKFADSLVDRETGELIKLTATRFRSSLVSELVEADVSVREIQLMLGHGSITTTLGYLDRMDFNSKAREKIKSKLEKIYHNTLIASDRTDASGISVQDSRRGEVIYKTPLGGCANIFNPPDFIKNSKSYDGGACSNFNKCLSCENVIITRSHLPDLFALLRDYNAAWGHGAIARTPHGENIRENISILDSILGKDSEFDKDELDEAKRLSMYIDSTILIDGVAL